MESDELPDLSMTDPVEADRGLLRQKSEPRLHIPREPVLVNVVQIIAHQSERT